MPRKWKLSEKHVCASWTRSIWEASQRRCNEPELNYISLLQTHMWTATLDNPPCRQKGLHDRIQLSSHNLKVGKSTQLNTEIYHSEWNDKSVGFSSKPPSSANKEDDKSISSYGCDEKRPVKNPEPGFHEGVFERLYSSEYTEDNFQKRTNGPPGVVVPWLRNIFTNTCY